MSPTLHHLATGIHASVYAYQTSEVGQDLPSRLGRSDDRNIDIIPSHQIHFDQGLKGWRALKVVRAGPSGKMRDLKPHNVLREVLILQKAKHPNIVQLLDYAWSESIWEHQLSLPLLAITFRTLLDSPILLPDPEDGIPDLSRLSVSPSRSTLDLLFASVSFQLLAALAHIHSLGIAHRDIKPENIMLDWDGKVVLIDFGIAWDRDSEDWGGEWKEEEDDMCCEVGTGPYRAPELLFGPTTYDTEAVDFWAAGSVLAEFFVSTRSPPTSDIDPLDGADMEEMSTAQTHTLFDCTYGDLGLAASIFGILGSPTSESWPSYTSLPDAGKISFTPRSSQPLYQLLPGLSQTSNPGWILSLLSSLLVLEPSRRISASLALGLDLFRAQEVLLPLKLIEAETYLDLGVQGVQILGGQTVSDLLGPVMRPARRKWDNMG